MIAWFARNPVAANLLMVTIVLTGYLALTTQLTLDVFPEADPETIRVSVPLRGATPEDIELGVAVRIEEAVQDLEGIDKISSTSVEGATTVLMEIDSDYDPREILDDVKSRVDAINTFPAETEKPVISLPVRKIAVIDIVISGDYSEEEITLFAEQVRDDLLRIEGITQTEVGSVRNYEIAIEVPQNRLREYNLTLSDISRAIRNSSVDISAGNLRTEGGDVLLRSQGQAYRRADFEAIVVKTNSDGSIIRLGDIANVNDSFEEESLKTRFNGEYSAFVKVYRVGNQSALELSEKVKTYISEKQEMLPEGLALAYWDDESKVLKNRLGILGSSALQGGILVIILLTLFLRPAIAFWVFIGIPVSFLGAVILMSIFDISLNLMSAFGFIVVLGIVVDDAIVTGENVYTHLRRSGSGVESAIAGTQEVAIPVTFGVLTTIVAFAPLLFLEGRLSAIFSPIAAVVIPVLLFSLIESKFVLPAHLAHVKVNPGSEEGAFQKWQSRFADGFEAMIIKYYRPVLIFVTRHRYSALASFIGVLVLIIALVVSGWTPFVFFPRTESDVAVARLTMPTGTPFEVTERNTEKLFKAAEILRAKYLSEESGQSLIKNILASTGSTGGRGASATRGIVQIETVPQNERDLKLSTTELIQEWRRLTGPLPGAESLTYRAEFFRAGDPIDVQFSGNSLDELSQIAEQVKERLATYPTVYEIADSMSDGKEELRIELTPQGHVLGLTRSDVVNQISEAFKGLQAQRIQRGREDVRVLVRLPAAERKTISTLNEMLITAPNGREIPLSHIATWEAGKGPSEIRRIDRYRVINVTADIEKDNTNMTVLQADLKDYIDILLTQYPGITYDMEGEAREQREAFGSLEAGLIVALFIIYCLLALPLKSYIEPLIVMSVIPFGIIGAVIGHWLWGVPLSIMSVFGLMALLGVLINDSLVLVDYVNRKYRTGIELYEAVLAAGVARFRPIMLTSITTFFGLFPLMMEDSSTGKFLVPMAISLGFGIIFATAITLLLIPVNILIVEDCRRQLKSLFQRDNSAPAIEG